MAGKIAFCRCKNSVDFPCKAAVSILKGTQWLIDVHNLFNSQCTDSNKSNEGGVNHFECLSSSKEPILRIRGGGESHSCLPCNDQSSDSSSDCDSAGFDLSIESLAEQ